MADSSVAVRGLTGEPVADSPGAGEHCRAVAPAVGERAVTVEG
ncbi:hypothetical protein HMPREF0183_1380 [Brevibacterium mcbrellneri ATCC 49030]|uniref:Uncharacterized protein n=1 Tax=Brevibacterium mcbrellneri ATCC 49030 TaxID=585530 RepID=D4YN70_9MICO|nr:hypothetical protein HMPREF0183_1380 [Brevibacterium mcbrellneri ATCC 49030]